LTTKDHYDHHLGAIYSWMAGDFETKQREHQQFLETNNIVPRSTKGALDLGAGHGIQSVSLARLGFSVTAIDFNRQLLSELEQNKQQLPIICIEDDIRNVKKYENHQPEVIVCWGDTLTHQETLEDVNQFINDCCTTLETAGKLLFSFRDFTTALTGDDRFIPVKSDETKILTCCLDYEADRVRVTDLLHAEADGQWQQKVSSYYKLRLSPNNVVEMLTGCGMTITLNCIVNRMITLIAVKKPK
jgi:2-polyprenyl-3-methyl-5-hydroxy-6-metoxy-1,4-benzoquinol methylase